MSQILGGDFVFYDVLMSLCKEKKITAARVRQDLGISQSTMASWKARGLTPKMETLEKLADYFSVSVDLLIGNVDDSQQGPVHGQKPAQGPMYGSFSYEQMCDLYEGMTRSRLEAAYARLDLLGHQKVADYAEKLTKDPKRLVDPEYPYHYRPRQAPQSPPASTEGQSTTPPMDGSEGPQEGEWDRYGEDRCGGRRDK